MKKIISMFLICFLVITNIGVTAKADNGGTPIINSPTAALSQMEQWARKNGATEEFVGLAKLYYQLSPSHGGIDPAVAFAQAAKETGFGLFGGVIDASYHNPCGLKMAAGGDNYDPNAHQRFNTWSDGVSAHLDHLALYAGANGYPKQSGQTLDPRHFSYLYKTVSSVEDLGGKWAPSTTYGNEVVGSIKGIKSTPIPLVQRINIESLYNGESYTNSDINLSGWAVSDSGYKSIQVYVNNSFIGNAQYGTPRYDVQANYSNYSDSLSSGFKMLITKDKLVTGKNTILVKFLANDGRTEERSITVNYIYFKHMYNLELPNSDPVNSDLNIQGWSSDGTGTKSIEILVDGILKGQAQINIQRLDVGKYLSGYSDANNSGFKYTISKDNLSYGSHNLVINITQNSGNVATISKNFYYYKYAPIFNVDSPQDLVVKSIKDLTIQGWSLVYGGIKEINVICNGVNIGKATTGISRIDVGNAFPQYQENNSGYKFDIPYEKLQKGNNQFNFIITSNDGNVISCIKYIKFDELTFKGNIDSPQENVNNQDIVVSGWGIASSDINSVKVYVDNEYKGDAQIDIARTDVNSAFPEYKIPNSGYKFIIDKKTIQSGKHRLKLEFSTVSGNKYYQEKDFTLNKLNSLMNIESPDKNYYYLGKPTMSVSGWAITSDGIKDIKVYVDDNLVGNATYGNDRYDVASIFTNYNNSLKSGFSYDIDLSKYDKGKHTVKVVATSIDGSTMEQKKEITTYDTISRGNIESPDQAVYKNDNVVISGWAINYSKVKDIDVYVNDSYIGKATYGLNRTDVGNIFLDYPQASTSGYSFTLPANTLKANSNDVKVVITGYDDTKFEMHKQVNCRLVPKLNLETNYNGSTVTSDVKVSGWAIAHDGVKQVNVYVNNRLVGQARYGLQRYDVNLSYSEYANSLYSGFDYTISRSDLKFGSNNILVEMISNSGEKVQNNTVVNSTAKLIVVDPGHNYGGDYGAESTFNNVKYSETVLNMQVAVKLRDRLQAMGYVVKMTREPLEMPMDEYTDSLRKRSQLANDLNADLFISLHHDSGTSTSSGVSTYYSTFKPGLKNVQADLTPLTSGFDGWADTKPTKAAITSRDFASKVVSALASQCSYPNKGYFDRNLSVTVNTNMPSILVELGFISNPIEAVKCANSDQQQNKANVIADEVKKMF